MYKLRTKFKDLNNFAEGDVASQSVLKNPARSLCGQRHKCNRCNTLLHFTTLQHVLGGLLDQLINHLRAPWILPLAKRGCPGDHVHEPHGRKRTATGQYVYATANDEAAYTPLDLFPNPFIPWLPLEETAIRPQDLPVAVMEGHPPVCKAPPNF